MGAVEVSLSPAAGRDRLLDFLSEHWSADHVFVKAPALLDWQHLRSDGAEHNFIVGSLGGRIAGALGFIPQSHFDPELAEHRHLFLALWKVDPAAPVAGLGMLLLSHLRRIAKPAFIGAIGLSDMVTGIYEQLGYRQGVLDHHVLFDPERRDFRIAAGVPETCPRPSSGADVVLERLDEPALRALPASADRCFALTLPRKSRGYLIARYLRHPVYRYRLYALRRSETVLAFLVLRRVEARGACALRIVDVIGDQSALSGLGRGLLREIKSSGAEYVDLYSHGIEPEPLIAAGFVKRREAGGLLVPNYFEPFSGENKEIAFAYKCFGQAGGHVVLVRGDSDQDRPNSVPLVSSAAE